MKPLYVRIGGGLGNQMFNYAVGLKIAATTGRQLILDSTEFLGGVRFWLRKQV